MLLGHLKQHLLHHLVIHDKIILVFIQVFVVRIVFDVRIVFRMDGRNLLGGLLGGFNGKRNSLLRGSIYRFRDGRIVLRVLLLLSSQPSVQEKVRDSAHNDGCDEQPFDNIPHPQSFELVYMYWSQLERPSRLTASL